jgi:arylsulfate sulfotransferase
MNFGIFLSLCIHRPFHSLSNRCFISNNAEARKYVQDGGALGRPKPRGPGSRTPRFQTLVLFAAGLVISAFCCGCATGSPVSATQNPQVAQYSVMTEKPASVTVAFGKTSDYGLQTAPVQTPPGGGPVSVYVAGMQAHTTYHMQAVVQFADGTITKDVDRTFTTGSYPAGVLPSLTATTTPGQTPQPGIEILDPVFEGQPIVAVDLSGNILWAYNPNLTLNTAIWQAPKLLPNGDFIAVVSPASSAALATSAPAGTPNMVREFDLAGNTIKQITMPQLNSELAAAGFNLTLLLFHHDVTVLPNGHWLVLTNTIQNVVLTGQTTPTPVLGDVIVDLDANLQPAWVWNEFDHLDVNRHPWNFPDWTHTNALIYSPDDGNLVVSIRHQNWIVKVDYENGAGTGNVLWRLGQGGDFTLENGTDPTDWSYAQHGISFTTQNTTGVFGLAVMDNGDDRSYPGIAPATCGVNGVPACFSTIPIYQIDETAMTATLLFHQILPASLYTDFGGQAQTMANGDVEYDLCGLTPQSSQIFEVTHGANPQTVWNLQLNGNFAYRGYRLPSLYPGVQW